MAFDPLVSMLMHFTDADSNKVRIVLHATEKESTVDDLWQNEEVARFGGFIIRKFVLESEVRNVKKLEKKKTVKSTGSKER